MRLNKIKNMLFASRFTPYLFPALVVFAMLTATALRLNGSSISVYEYFLGEDVTQNLVIGQPRTVRSDEWAVNTPFIVSQIHDGFPEFSKDISDGQDMSVVIDVPYGDWSAAFKPQNLVFFVLPPDYAFAFKWWMLATVLLVAVYCFVLTLYPKRYLLASLVSVAFFLSPFIQWWYQTITILPIAYALLSVSLATKVIQDKKRSYLWSATLAYVLICFILTMYPAFQITSALFALGAFILALSRNGLYKQLLTKRMIITYALIILTSLLVAGLYIYQHLEVIKAIQSTVYPGERNVTSGGFGLVSLLVWPLSYLTLEGGPLTVFDNNQSEVSNFLLVGYLAFPLLLIMSIRERIKKLKRPSFSQLEHNLLILAFVLSVVLAIRMFTPIGSELFALVGLNKVPHVRLLLAFGLINMLIILIAVGRDGTRIRTWRDTIDKLPIAWFFVITICVFFTLTYVRNHFDIATTGWKELLIISALFAITTAALLHKAQVIRYWGLSLLIVASAISAGLANPIYKGLGAFDNDFTRYVSSTEKSNQDYWVVDDNPVLSSLLVSTGAETHGGVNTYPQEEIWHKYFNTSASIYNRYSHVRYVIDDAQAEPALELVQSDSFKVHVSSCDPFLKDLKVKYIISDKKPAPQYKCSKSTHTLIAGKRQINIYEIK